MGKKWNRFKHLDEEEYWEEICNMTEERLRLEHKILQQNVLSASAAAGATGVAGIWTLGTAWILTGVNARRYNVNSRQVDIVERRLREMGWTGYDLRKRDLLYSVGPGVAAELIVPAGGALLSQAGHAATHHAMTVAGQHALQAANQHTVQLATQHAAENLASQHTAAALGSIAHCPGTFAQAALSGVQSQIFTASHGLLGHAAFYYYPTDLATAQAHVLGETLGQLATAEATKEAANKGVKYATKATIGRAISTQDTRRARALAFKNNFWDDEFFHAFMLAVQETKQARGLGSKGDISEAEVGRILIRAGDLLLDDYYRSLQKYDFGGKLKSSFREIDTCKIQSCDCGDYNDKNKSRASSSADEHECLCGHAWHEHERPTEDVQAKGLTSSFCRDWYGKLQHREFDGTLKKTLDKIDPCQAADCDCEDYDMEFSTTETHPNCIGCGHGWGRHAKEGETNTQEIFGKIAVLYLVSLL